MTELMKRYEAERGRKPKDLFMGSEESLIHFTREYVEWLEAQLTWRPVSEKPERDGKYLVQYKFETEVRTRETIFDYHHDRWWNFAFDVARQKHGIIAIMLQYLPFPIPPAPEGE